MKNSIGILIPVVSLFLLFSCAKDHFSVEGITFNRSINIEFDQAGEMVSSQERVSFSPSIIGSGPFSVKVISPERDLIWEGEVKNRHRFYMDITDGATFPVGEYTFIFYNSDGQDLELNARMAKVDDLDELGRFVEYRGFVGKDSVSMKVYDEKDNVIDDILYTKGDELPEGYHHYTYSFKDRYGNDITVRQVLLEEN